MSTQLKFFLDTVYSKPALHPHERQIIEALTEGPMTQSELFYLFNGRLKKSRLMPILENLVSAGLITSTHERSGGRPRTVWSLVQ
jgi:DNA-binding PadR family transcriptional regulator